jgi:hypothetical protein
LAALLVAAQSLYVAGALAQTFRRWGKL